jgi:hypothetical protein
MNSQNPEDRVRYLIGKLMLEREILVAELEKAHAEIRELKTTQAAPTVLPAVA